MIISDSLLAQAQAAADAFLRTTRAKPVIGLILGSGLGEFASELADSTSTPAAEIPFYPVSTVSGHSGRVITGRVVHNGEQSAHLVVFQGRTHFYETGKLGPVLFPTYLAKALGVQTLIVTNAAGGVRRSFRPGDLMLIKDILNLTFLPLGNRKTLARSSARILDPVVRQHFLENAEAMGLALEEGTYCWVKGPSYETAAEIEMLSRLQADAVGMSTVPELTHAALLGVQTAGLSLISNFATGITGQKLSHTEVTETASKVKDRFSTLLRATLVSLSRLKQA